MRIFSNTETKKNNWNKAKRVKKLSSSIYRVPNIWRLPQTNKKNSSLCGNQLHLLKTSRHSVWPRCVNPFVLSHLSLHVTVCMCVLVHTYCVFVSVQGFCVTLQVHLQHCCLSLRWVCFQALYHDWCCVSRWQISGDEVKLPAISCLAL